MEAFSSLIKFIYDVPGYISPANARQKLFEIYDVAEKYQATRLVAEVRENMVKLVTKIENKSEDTIVPLIMRTSSKWKTRPILT